MIKLTKDELFLLKGKSLLANRLYLEILTNLNTKALYTVNYNQLIKGLTIEKTKGKAEYKPTKGQIRQGLIILEQTGLITRMDGVCRPILNNLYLERYNTVSHKKLSAPKKIDNYNINNELTCFNDDRFSTVNSDRFSMTLVWSPDLNLLKEILEEYDFRYTDIKIKELSQYREFWAYRPDILRTENEWCLGLIRWCAVRLEKTA